MPKINPAQPDTSTTSRCAFQINMRNAIKRRKKGKPLHFHVPIAAHMKDKLQNNEILFMYSGMKWVGC